MSFYQGAAGKPEANQAGLWVYSQLLFQAVFHAANNPDRGNSLGRKPA
jgi:hypothetical protein